MTAAYDDVPFSELLHHPAATAERLDVVRALRLLNLHTRTQALQQDLAALGDTTKSVQVSGAWSDVSGSQNLTLAELAGAGDGVGFPAGSGGRERGSGAGSDR
jgi:hypothetical protein